MIKLHILKMGMAKPVQTKYGKKFKNYIKVSEAEYRDKFLNFWTSAATKDWAEGREIEVEGVQEQDYPDKEGFAKKSYNIILPKHDSNEALKLIHDRLTKLEAQTEALGPMYMEWKKKDNSTRSDGEPMPDFGEAEIDPDDIPF